MLTVCCVLSDGPKRSYEPKHVQRLYEQVQKHMKGPYRFVCLTNRELPCETLKLTSEWPGWWAKIELFRPGMFKSGSKNHVLYLDLDIDIVGTLNDFSGFPAEFAIIKDWARPGFNSSIMAWDADSGVTDDLYAKFGPKVMERLKGDQDWINEMLPKATTFPQWWALSYRGHIQPRGGRVPPSCRAVIYHGQPKSWDLDTAQAVQE